MLLQKNPEYAFVKIKDYGCGMDEDTKKRVFHKFIKEIALEKVKDMD